MKEKMKKKAGDDEVYLTEKGRIITRENFNLLRMTAFYHLQEALNAAGKEVLAIEVEKDPDTLEDVAVVHFAGGRRERANIHMDSIGTALFDVLRQIQELRY